MKLYFEIALLLSLLAIIVKGLQISAGALQISQVQLLRLGQILLVGALLVPLFGEFIPREVWIRPPTQVWSEMNTRTRPLVRSADATVAAVQKATKKNPALKQVQTGLEIALALGVVAMLLRRARQFRQLQRHLEKLPVLHSIRRVKILTEDRMTTPYSAWISGRAYIVVPWLEQSPIALRHEIQHHRNGDTKWIYAYEILKAVFFWNPAVAFLVRRMTEIQEFACDEHLVGHQKVSPLAYGRCLFQAAQTAVDQRPMWVGTAHMAASANGKTLKRRVEMLFEYSARKTRKRYAAILAVVTLTLFASASYAAKTATVDRKLSLADVQILVSKTQTGIPLNVNELVLAKLNKFLGTPEKRAWLRDSFKRMQQYQSMVDQKSAQYGVPQEIIALAVHESGFRNDLISPYPARAAGVWQFIPDTARRYDLIVTELIDERFDVEKETVAAMRYLSDLNDLFGDWRLALKAYNEGEERVDQLFKQHGTKDPWELERKSKKDSYLAGAIAMIIIYRNPALL